MAKRGDQCRELAIAVPVSLQRETEACDAGVHGADGLHHP